MAFLEILSRVDANKAPGGVELDEQSPSDNDFDPDTKPKRSRSNRKNQRRENKDQESDDVEPPVTAGLADRVKKITKAAMSKVSEGGRAEFPMKDTEMSTRAAAPGKINFSKINTDMRTALKVQSAAAAADNAFSGYKGTRTPTDILTPPNPALFGNGGRTRQQAYLQNTREREYNAATGPVTRPTFSLDPNVARQSADDGSTFVPKFDYSTLVGDRTGLGSRSDTKRPAKQTSFTARLDAKPVEQPSYFSMRPDVTYEKPAKQAPYDPTSVRFGYSRQQETDGGATGAASKTKPALTSQKSRNVQEQLVRTPVPRQGSAKGRSPPLTYGSEDESEDGSGVSESEEEEEAYVPVPRKSSIASVASVASATVSRPASAGKGQQKQKAPASKLATMTRAQLGSTDDYDL